MPTIRTDDDVYAVLTRGLSYGITPNTALRALLGLPPTDFPTPATPSTATTRRGRRPQGNLAPLIDAGLLREGAELTWHRSQRGETHRAIVTANGHLLTSDGREHATPGMCATTLAGYPCRGWKEWRTSGGTTLHDLRDQFLEQQTRSSGAASAGDR